MKDGLSGPPYQEEADIERAGVRLAEEGEDAQGQLGVLAAKRFGNTGLAHLEVACEVHLAVTSGGAAGGFGELVGAEKIERA